MAGASPSPSNPQIPIAASTTRTTTTAPSSSPSSSSSLSSQQYQINDWITVQDDLRKRLVTSDDYEWELPSPTPSSSRCDGGGEGKEEVLRYIGGVDVSYSKEDPTIACGAIVVLDLKSLEVVYDDYSVVRIQVPYVPGFLAFREVPILLGLLQKIKRDTHPFYPQLLMVDGNGLLHPRGFGLACHLGILADIPTIGVGKNLHHMEGLTRLGVKELLQCDSCIELVDLIGTSGRTLGVAMKSTLCAVKPIFISIGHRISLATGVEVVKLTCKYRVPEPIRLADIRSREYLRRHPFASSNCL